MAAIRKRIPQTVSILILLALLAAPCFAAEETVYGPKDMKVSRLHFHLSFHTFSVDEPGEGTLRIRKCEGAEEIRGGFVLLNQEIMGLQDFLKKSEAVYEKKVHLKSRNLLTVFIAGNPGSVLSVEIRTASSFLPPPEVEFAAEPSVINRGETSTLRWATKYAETVRIDPGIGVVDAGGSASVSPGKTTEYTLTAIGKGGDTTRIVKVEVEEGLSVSITSPLAGDRINGSRTLVKGTVDYFAGMETGVTVNGIIALVYGKDFAASGVPLEDGENVITVVAVDGEGNRAETSLTVQAYAAEHEIRITAEPDSGILPFESVLKVDRNFNFTQPSLSYTGPGGAEILENLNANEYILNITLPGLYTFNVDDRDDFGRVYTDSVVVLAMDGAFLDALLKQKWGGMKHALAAGDIGKAVECIAYGARNMFEYNFTLLSAHLVEISAGLRSCK